MRHEGLAVLDGCQSQRTYLLLWQKIPYVGSAAEEKGAAGTKGFDAFPL